MKSQRNLVTVFALFCILGAMGALVSYSVPLYKLFCRVMEFFKRKEPWGWEATA